MRIYKTRTWADFSRTSAKEPVSYRFNHKTATGRLATLASRRARVCRISLAGISFEYCGREDVAHVQVAPNQVRPAMSPPTPTSTRATVSQARFPNLRNNLICSSSAGRLIPSMSDRPRRTGAGISTSSGMTPKPRSLDRKLSVGKKGLSEERLDVRPLDIAKLDL